MVNIKILKVVFVLGKIYDYGLPLGTLLKAIVQKHCTDCTRFNPFGSTAAALSACYFA
jgi:hypothetical protein